MKAGSIGRPLIGLVVFLVALGLWQVFTLGIDLDSVLPRAGIAHDEAVLQERLGVALGADLVEQPRRAVDVGEQKGDSARRKITQSLDDAPRRAGDQRPGGRR